MKPCPRSGAFYATFKANTLTRQQTIIILESLSTGCTFSSSRGKGTLNTYNKVFNLRPAGQICSSSKSHPIHEEVSIGGFCPSCCMSNREQHGNLGRKLHFPSRPLHRSLPGAQQPRIKTQMSMQNIHSGLFLAFRSSSGKCDKVATGVTSPHSITH